MKLYVLEKIGLPECTGIIAKDRVRMKKIMKLKAIGNNQFETIINKNYEDYAKEQAEKYRYPYEPFIEKYELIFKCIITDANQKEGIVFHVEE